MHRYHALMLINGLMKITTDVGGGCFAVFMIYDSYITFRNPFSIRHVSNIWRISLCYLLIFLLVFISYVIGPEYFEVNINYFLSLLSIMDWELKFILQF